MDGKEIKTNPILTKKKKRKQRDELDDTDKELYEENERIRLQREAEAEAEQKDDNSNALTHQPSIYWQSSKLLLRTPLTKHTVLSATERRCMNHANKHKLLYGNMQFSPENSAYYNVNPAYTYYPSFESLSLAFLSSVVSRPSVSVSPSSSLSSFSSPSLSSSLSLSQLPAASHYQSQSHSRLPLHADSHMLSSTSAPLSCLVAASSTPSSSVSLLMSSTTSTSSGPLTSVKSETLPTMHDTTSTSSSLDNNLKTKVDEDEEEQPHPSLTKKSKHIIEISDSEEDDDGADTRQKNKNKNKQKNKSVRCNSKKDVDDDDVKEEEEEKLSIMYASLREEKRWLDEITIDDYLKKKTDQYNLFNTACGNGVIVLNTRVWTIVESQTKTHKDFVMGYHSRIVCPDMLFHPSHPATLIMPINLHDNHWCFMEIVVASHELIFWDSRLFDFIVDTNTQNIQRTNDDGDEEEEEEMFSGGERDDRCDHDDNDGGDNSNKGNGDGDGDGDVDNDDDDQDDDDDETQTPEFVAQISTNKEIKSLFAKVLLWLENIWAMYAKTTTTTTTTKSTSPKSPTKYDRAFRAHKWTTLVRTDAPQQARENVYDCGVYMLACIEHIIVDRYTVRKSLMSSSSSSSSSLSSSPSKNCDTSQQRNRLYSRHTRRTSPFPKTDLCDILSVRNRMHSFLCK